MFKVRILSDAVRKICVQYRFFTCGTVKDYDALFEFCNSFTWSVNGIEPVSLEIARNILSRSDVTYLEEALGREVDVEFIAGLILNRALEFITE